MAHLQISFKGCKNRKFSESKDIKTENVKISVSSINIDG